MPSYCKSCGTEIKWIKMASGKNMPVDAKPISYRIEWNGDLTLVTEEGKGTKGVFDPGSDKIGYISHFSSCPNANYHRSRR